MREGGGTALAPLLRHHVCLLALSQRALPQHWTRGGPSRLGDAREATRVQDPSLLCATRERAPGMHEQAGRVCSLSVFLRRLLGLFCCLLSVR